MVFQDQILIIYEAVSKCLILFKIKKGENFNLTQILGKRGRFELAHMPLIK